MNIKKYEKLYNQAYYEKRYAEALNYLEMIKILKEGKTTWI